jgi:hypothetical protein
MPRVYSKSPQQMELEMARLKSASRLALIFAGLWISSGLMLVLSRGLGISYGLARAFEITFAVGVVFTILSFRRRRYLSTVWAISQSLLFASMPTLGAFTAVLPDRPIPATMDEAIQSGAPYASFKDITADHSRSFQWHHESETRQAKDPSAFSSIDRELKSYRYSTSVTWSGYALVKKNSDIPKDQRPIEGWLVCELLTSSSASCQQESYTFNGESERIKPSGLSDYLNGAGYGAGFSLWRPVGSVDETIRGLTDSQLRIFHWFCLGVLVLLALRTLRLGRIARSSTFKL